MNFLTRAFSGKEPEKKDTNNTNKGFDVNLTPFNLPQAPAKMAKSYMESYENWIYPNIYAIAEPVANMEFKLMKVVGEEAEEVKQHQILELINRFNPYMTKYQVLFTTVAHKKLVGEAAWYVVRQGIKPVEIYPIRPDFVEVIPGDLNQGEFVKHYVYKIEGKETIIKPENMIFHKEVNPLNCYRGYGVIQAASTILDVDNYAREWNKNLMYNSGNVGGVFSTEGRLDSDIIKRIKDQLKKEYMGFRNAGKLMVLEGGLKLEQEPKTPHELDFNVSREKTRDEIAAMFRNPKPVLGITDDVNRANAEATEYVHTKNVIKNEMAKLCEDLNEYLLPMFGAESLFLTFEDPTPENEALNIDKYFKLTNKVFTVNEAREEFNLDPLDDEQYDTIQAPVSPVSLQDDENTTDDKKKPEKPSKRLTTKKTVRLTERQKNAIKYRKEIKRVLNKNVGTKLKKKDFDVVLAKALSDMISKKMPVKSVKENLTPAVPEIKPNLYDLVLKFENKIYNKLNREWYPKLEAETLANVDKFQKSVEGAVFDQPPAVEACFDLTYVLFEVLGQKAGQEALKALGEDMVFDLNEGVKKIIEGQTRTFATITTETAYNKMVGIIDNGIKEGKSILDIKRDIRQGFKDLKSYQAERIARTEVSRNFHLGQIEAWKQTGYITGKKWVLDGNPCPICESAASMYGDIGIPLDMPFYEKNENVTEKFVNSYSDCQAPPLHPNCKCHIEGVRGGVEKDFLDELDKMLGEEQ